MTSGGRRGLLFGFSCCGLSPKTWSYCDVLLACLTACLSKKNLMILFLKNGIKQNVVAKLFAISEMQVTRIKRNENWAHIKLPEEGQEQE